MMAFCGLNCSECPAHKGTLGSDLTLLEETARKWSDKDHSYQVKDMFCLGCTQPDGRFVFSYCRECPVRVCALEKKVTNCVACPEYDGCAKVSKLQEVLGRPTLKAKMKLMRERVLAS
jgi:hypothetical protein